MGWRELIQVQVEMLTLPWTGGRTLHAPSRTYKVMEPLPKEFGWYRFTVTFNAVRNPSEAEPCPEVLGDLVTGYLVGDRLVPDDTRVDPDPSKIVDYSEKVYLLPEGLDRFARVRAGRVYSEGPLIFLEDEFSLGPEEEVMNAYLDGKKAVHEIVGVVPGLDAAFRMEVYQREEAERRRRELERQRAEEEARRERERKRQELLERLGDGAGRRAMARQDFREAARAALTVGGAEYLDHRPSEGGEWTVKYRVDGQRLECVCDTNLQIIDAGVCLKDHGTGEKGDTYFTLESLPAVIRQAVREDALVIWRHV